MAVVQKNKWLSQSIQKKQNKIQNASKHTGTSPHRIKDKGIIFKRKSPLKQRRDRKKFKSQRRSKKVLKQMAFDYNDFVGQNQSENHQRIQIRPTIGYSCDRRGIQYLDEFNESTEDEGALMGPNRICIHCYPYRSDDNRQQEECAFCSFICDDTLANYIVDDEFDDKMNAAESHYSTMRNKTKPKRNSKTKPHSKRKSSTFSSESISTTNHHKQHLSRQQRERAMDSNGIIYQNYLNHLNYRRSLDRARHKLYSTVSPQICRLIDSIKTSTENDSQIHNFGPDKVSVECLLNDFWLRLWMNKFGDITNEIVYVKKTLKHCKSQMKMDLNRYHRMFKDSRPDRLIAFYLTRHDIDAFAPMNVVQICMSYCGLIPPLLSEKYNGSFPSNSHCEDIEYDAFIEWSRRKSTCYKMYLSYSDGVDYDCNAIKWSGCWHRWSCSHYIRHIISYDYKKYRWSRHSYPWFDDEFTICALIGESMKWKKQQVLNDSLLPLFSVRVGKETFIGLQEKQSRSEEGRCNLFNYGNTESHSTTFEWIGVNKRDQKRFGLTE